MRVAVLGAGYAGLTCANALEDRLPDDVELVVVDEDGSHLLQHELHRVVRRPSLAEELVVDLEDVFDRATVREARVTDVAPADGVATLGAETSEDDSGDENGSDRLAYDAAAVCLGAETDFADLPGVETHATPLKRLDHAREIRADFLDALAAAMPADPATVVVGGAGLSGVQVAGELAALAREEGAGKCVEVVLLEQEDAVAPTFAGEFRTAVREELTARDVVVRTGVGVASADEAGIDLVDGTDLDLADGDRLAYDQFVWTGGIRGPDALGGERPVARSTLRLEDGTFVVGDAARVVDADGEAVPASAQTAVRQGRVAAANVEKVVTHEREGGSGFQPRLEGYRFEGLGWLVSVGDGAVAQVGPAVFTGRAAKALKTTVGAGYLTRVGAVEGAVDLVREELGWPDAADVDVSAGVEEIRSRFGAVAGNERSSDGRRDDDLDDER